MSEPAPGSAPVVRRATEQDCPALLALYNHAVLTTTATWDLDTVDLDDRRAWLRTHRLLRELIAAAREHRIHVMVGVLSSENEVSVRLHRALGFVEVARMPQVGHKFGRWLDAVMLQLILDERVRPAEADREE